jgi:hypothetical protein
MSHDLFIPSANPAVEVIFNQKPEHFIGNIFGNILMPPMDGASSLNSFFGAVDSAMSCLRPPSNEIGEVQEKPTNSEEISILLCRIKDMTSTIASGRLLQRGAREGRVPPEHGPPRDFLESFVSASIMFEDIFSFTRGADPSTHRR